MGWWSLRSHVLLNGVRDTMQKYGPCVQCGVEEVVAFYVNQDAAPNLGTKRRS